jgi:hypothetical protein
MTFPHDSGIPGLECIGCDTRLNSAIDAAAGFGLAWNRFAASLRAARKHGFSIETLAEETGWDEPLIRILAGEA